MRSVASHASVPESREGGVRTVETLRGPAGRLEALLNPGRSSFAVATHSVLLCHPHPLYGGTLHNKVVYHAMKVFIDLGYPVLRFNFRGAGRSEGEHDKGAGEQEDVRAGLDWLEQEFALPVIAAGFSFGAHTAMRAGFSDPRVDVLVSLGTPLAAAGRSYNYDFLAECSKPKLFLSGAADEYGERGALEAALAVAAQPKRIEWVDAADHFFKGYLPQMQSALRTWLLATLLPVPAFSGVEG